MTGDMRKPDAVIDARALASLTGVPFVVDPSPRPGIAPFVIDTKTLFERLGAYAEPLRAVGPVQSGTLRETKPRGEP